MDVQFISSLVFNIISYPRLSLEHLDTLVRPSHTAHPIRKELTAYGRKKIVVQFLFSVQTCSFHHRHQESQEAFPLY